MPIVKRGKSYAYEYRLPKRKKNLMTKAFLQSFKEKLNEIFPVSPEIPDTYWSRYAHLESTCGFYKALKAVSEEYNVTKAIYQYSQKMPWYDSDLFDYEITKLMIERGVIEEGDIEESCFGNIDYEGDPDFELIKIEEKRNGYTVVHQEWEWTNEAKKKFGVE